MGLNLNYQPGQTPIDEDEKTGLKIPTITTHAELNEFEHKNIEQAIQWSLSRKFKPENVISERFVQSLHKRMFGDVWTWAGKYRLTNKNIGVDKWQISTELRKLIDDTLYWINHKTFSDYEITIRFKHRLVSIHCFPNGNGRHSRLMADIIIHDIFDRDFFTWGQSLEKSELRSQYLKALRSADLGDYSELIHFARS